MRGNLRSRATLIGLVAVSGLSVVSSLLGFIFQVVLAAYFGASAAIDSYLFAISAPTFLAGLGAAALSYMVVPALVVVENDPAARASLLQMLRRRVGGIAICFMAVGIPANLVQQRLLLPAAADLREIAALPAMIVLGWLIGGTQLFTALFTIELNAARRPVVAALLSLPPNLAAIGVVLVVPQSIVAAPAGVLFGSLVATVLGVGLTWRSFRPCSEVGIFPSSPADFKLGRLCWTLLAMSCFSAYAVIDAFWAPRAGGGTLASLGYAQRLVIGVGGLILAGPSAVLTPRFAARLRDSGEARFLSEVVRTVMVVGALAAGTALMLALIASPLIDAAFGRGAFDLQDVARVSTVFKAMLPGFWAMLMSVVLTRAIYCLPDIERPMALIGLGWSIIYFFACGAFLPLGGFGFGISYSLAWLAYLLISALVLYRYARRST